jgi:hypothetical protein
MSNHNVGQQYGVISEGASGDNAQVTGISGSKIRVIGYTYICTAANTITWKSGSTALTGAMAYTTFGGIATPESYLGHFETADGEDLNLNLLSSQGVRGHFTYVVLPVDA